MYTVIGAIRSRTIRVLWLLEELNLPYNFEMASPHSDLVRRHNIGGKIPVLIEKDMAFTDSTAIMTYLADCHGKFTFTAGTRARAHQDGHTNFLLDEMDSCLWTATRHANYIAKEHRVPEIISSMKRDFETAQQRFIDRLGAGPFLMGDTITVADIIAAHCGGWAIRARFPITQPAFRDYVDRMCSRPAFLRAQKNG